MNIQWNAGLYKDSFSFVPDYGSSVMELIDFDKAENAVDLGCGNGTLTAKLKEKGLDVTGVDASDEMLALARQSYPDIVFKKADATAFAVDKKVDLVFSNAVFHWIDKEKQPLLLKCVSDSLVSRGQFVFEFGGYGCAESIHSELERVFQKHGYNYLRCFYFPTVGEYAPLVEEAGMRVKTALLFDRPTAQKGEDGLKNWINMFVKTPFETVKSGAEKEEIINETLGNLREKLYINDTWYVDYVRIRMKTEKL